MKITWPWHSHIGVHTFILPPGNSNGPAHDRHCDRRTRHISMRLLKFHSFALWLSHLFVFWHILSCCYVGYNLSKIFEILNPKGISHTCYLRNHIVPLQRGTANGIVFSLNILGQCNYLRITQKIIMKENRRERDKKGWIGLNYV